MTLVYNTPGLVVAIASLAAALAAEGLVGFGETDSTASLLTGFALMAGLGGVAEWRLSPANRPRYFWIFPAWIVGLAAIGLILHDRIHVPAGIAVLSAAGLAFAVHVVLETRGPGGKWVAWMGAATLGLLVESLLEEWLVEGKPWWGVAIRSVLIVVLAYATARAWWARRAAARAARAD